MIGLKDHRFNRLFDCPLALLHNLYDIKLYLDRFSYLMNDIAILNRSFLIKDIFEPVLCAMALIGIHGHSYHNL